MYPLSYGSIYKVPETYKPPDENDLSNDTGYPNLNCRDYCKRPLNRQFHMYEAWDCIALNEYNHGVIATNKLHGREWNGSFWGFEDLTKQLISKNSCFKIQSKWIITKLQFVCKNIILVALNSGALQLWTTYTDGPHTKPEYCLSLVEEKIDHESSILCMDVNKTNCSKALTGCKGGTIKVWDLGVSHLYFLNTYRFAHVDSITGIVYSPNDKSVFATCSLDKCALLWDDRLPRPASAILSDHKVRFRDIKWTNNEKVCIGDESGYIHKVDVRKPKKIIQSHYVLDRPIQKIIPKEKHIAVIGDTNIVKILSEESQNIIYENNDSKRIIRDAVWYTNNELYTVGYEGKLRRHKL